ncbi:MAG: cytochrome c [Chitinophagales bacterium]|mgnify:CR=1 FL=1|nr:cytochrome c [Chitinophagales bacterium]
MRILFYSTIALLLAVAACSKKSAAPTATKEKVYSGTNIFAKSCARCHGADGVKDERTPNLKTIPLDKAGLVKVISYGKGHMPAFADKLNTQEIEAVADLILSWHK